MADKIRNVLAVNFRGDTVNLCYGKRAGAKYEITGIKVFDIKSCDAIGIAKLLKDNVKALKASNFRVILSIDSHAVITKNIEVPSTSDKEIKEIIDLQSGRYTPYAREEIIIDHVNIGTYHNSYTKVLVVIVVQAELKRQIEIINLAGFQVARVQYAAENIGLSCIKLLKIEKKASPSVVVRISQVNSDFIIISKGMSVFVRNIPVGHNDFLADKNASILRFADELKKSFDAYRAEEIDVMPDEINFIGPVDMVELVKASASMAFTMPSKDLLFYKSVSVPAEVIQEDKKLALSSLIALVISAEDARIDLRPLDLKLKMAFQERSKEIIKSGFLVMLIVIFICAMLLVRIYYRGVYLSGLQEQLKSTSPDVANLEGKLSKIIVIKDALKKKNHALDSISWLYELIPTSVYLKNISIDQDSTIFIKGTAEAMSEVFALVTSLENSKYFKDVTAQNTANRKEAGKDVADFEISAKLEQR
ncbi:MAG: pilus assembly protein PilM [Candidatus Omnitrophica bacterium]|jgi:type IV pilus assembly protein PilM|nr:pilus assembly protein PilM [Candidatus Omnitrophota bacterium]